MDIYGIILAVAPVVTFVLFMSVVVSIVWDWPHWLTVVIALLAALIGVPLSFRSLTAQLATIVIMSIVWTAVYKIMNRDWFWL